MMVLGININMAICQLATFPSSPFTMLGPQSLGHLSATWSLFLVADLCRPRFSFSALGTLDWL